MIYISHRGNINGKNPERENSPDYILEAIEKGYDVEIDVWWNNGKWFLGHDSPTYQINFYELVYDNKKLWLHAKNHEALREIVKYFNYLNIYWLKFFWHQTDDFTLTSNGYIWTYPGKELTIHSICVLPETANYSNEDLKICYGICSDNIEKYKIL